MEIMKAKKVEKAREMKKVMEVKKAKETKKAKVVKKAMKLYIISKNVRVFFKVLKMLLKVFAFLIV